MRLFKRIRKKERFQEGGVAPAQLSSGPEQGGGGQEEFLH
jgi:hypothetical protein